MLSLFKCETSLTIKLAQVIKLRLKINCVIYIIIVTLHYFSGRFLYIYHQGTEYFLYIFHQ